MTTDASGRFAFNRVIPGSGHVGRMIELNENKGSMGMSSAALMAAEFNSGKTTRIDLEASGRPVIGQLQRSLQSKQDIPWRFALINVTQQSPHPDLTFMATCDQDGNFSIDNVPPGNYMLKARFWKQPRDRLSNHRFSVPTIDQKLSQRPVDLGVLTLQSAGRP